MRTAVSELHRVSVLRTAVRTMDADSHGETAFPVTDGASDFDGAAQLTGNDLRIAAGVHQHLFQNRLGSVLQNPVACFSAIPTGGAESLGHLMNANSNTAPGIVDADCQPILDRSEVYSGVYGRASVNFYAFNSNGNRGIACSLNNLQKIRDGEHLGGKSSAEDDFATDDEEDFLD